MKKLISIIAPMYNEENIVHPYCLEVSKITKELSEKYDFEIILVNDGSVDNTYNAMLDEQINNRKEISVICLTRNFGLEGAINAGLKKAKGDAVIVMDADLQDPPQLIYEMIKKWENGADIIIAKRQSRPTDTMFKKISANLYYRLLNLLSGNIKLEENAANYRLLSKKALKQLLLLPETNSVFRITVPFLGMKIETINYNRDKRYAGKTKYNIRKMIPYALDSITGLSIEPLRKVSILLVIPIIILIISFAFLSTKQFPDNYFWLLIIIISFLFLIIMFMLSIINEYLAQIMIEVKGRPISIVYDYIPSKNAEVRKK